VSPPTRSLSGTRHRPPLRPARFRDRRVTEKRPEKVGWPDGPGTGSSVDQSRPGAKKPLQNMALTGTGRRKTVYGLICMMLARYRHVGVAVEHDRNAVRAAWAGRRREHCGGSGAGGLRRMPVTTVPAAECGRRRFRRPVAACGIAVVTGRQIGLQASRGKGLAKKIVGARVMTRW